MLGSCNKDVEIPQSLFIENFTLTFNNSTAYDSFFPSFNYQDGDLIIIETKNEWDEWTALPYIVDIDIHLEGGYNTSGTVWVYLYNDDQTYFYPPAPLEVQFRAALIKSNALQINPDIKDMTIDEINSTI